MRVRQFRESSIEAARAFLAAARTSGVAKSPREMLEDDKLTTAVEPALTVEPRTFADRRDAAKYLTELLAPLPVKEVVKNAGLWTWLGMYFFDEICPAKNGRRSVKKDYYYIFEPGNARYHYRHLLFVGWRMLRIAPAHNRLFLRNPVSTLDMVTEIVSRSLYLTRIPCMFEVLDRLYWDERVGRARPGIVDGRVVHAGNLKNRLPVRIRQLEKTYDLFSLTADQLIDLLGEEFQFDARASNDSA